MAIELRLGIWLKSFHNCRNYLFQKHIFKTVRKFRTALRAALNFLTFPKILQNYKLFPFHFPRINRNIRACPVGQTHFRTNYIIIKEGLFKKVTFKSNLFSFLVANDLQVTKQCFVDRIFWQNFIPFSDFKVHQTAFKRLYEMMALVSFYFLFNTFLENNNQTVF